MKLLLDTRLLLWTMISPERLSPLLKNLIQIPTNTVYFSEASMWEATIKGSRGRFDFHFEEGRFRKALATADFKELKVQTAHVEEASQLPYLHKDPFDRLLIAQATVEGIQLYTTDAAVARYPGPIRKV